MASNAAPEEVCPPTLATGSQPPAAIEAAQAPGLSADSVQAATANQVGFVVRLDGVTPLDHGSVAANLESFCLSIAQIDAGWVFQPRTSSAPARVFAPEDQQQRVQGTFTSWPGVTLEPIK